MDKKIIKFKSGVVMLRCKGGGARATPVGNIRLDLPNGKWTSIHYFNRDPVKAIPMSYNRYYLHPELPAYMVKKGNTFYVGTPEQLIKEIVE